MAAPASITIDDLSGKYVMNKSLSDNSDAILALQGVSWLTRSAIALATITLHINHTPATDDKPAEIIIVQVLTGGMRGTTEKRVFDWTPREHKDHVFGTVEGRSRFLTGGVSVVDNEMQTKLDDGKSVDPDDLKFIKAEVLVDLKTPSSFLDAADAKFAQSWVVNFESGWTAEQIWGFEEINGERRYTRRIVVRKMGDDKKVVRARFVYDYLGAPELKE